MIKGGMLEGSDEELYDLFISWQKKKRRKKKERKKKKKDVLAKISIFQAKLCCSRASWGFS